MGIELFERAAENGGRILRVEQLSPPGGSTDASRGPGYLLTLDVGRILVAANPKTGGLVISQIPAGEELGVRLLALDEEEPWWRVVGNPIARVWPVGSDETTRESGAEVRGVRLQFRADHENPKLVSLGFDDDQVRVVLEDAHDA